MDETIIIEVLKLSVPELQSAVDVIDRENNAIFPEMVNYTNQGNLEAAYECAEQIKRNNRVKYLILNQLHGDIVDCFRN